MDREGKGLLDSKELLAFLRDNDAFHWSESNTYYLMKFYDTDEDEALDYTDFLQLVLPCEDPELRAIATQRDPNLVSKDEYLPGGVENEMLLLLEMEMELHSQIEPLKQKI